MQSKADKGQDSFSRFTQYVSQGWQSWALVTLTSRTSAKGRRDMPWCLQKWRRGLGRFCHIPVDIL